MVPCVVMGVAAWLAATGANPPPPATAVSHAFTATMEREVDDMGSRAVRERETPGLAVGVVEDGRVVYARGFGYGNVARRLRFDPATQTYVGEVSEQFTAAALLLLQQDGKLKLDDKIVKYVPELTIAHDVTIAQLLEHTSGLPDLAHIPGIPQDRTRSIKMADLLAAVEKSAMAATPGATFKRNDLDYMIAGFIVERASAVPLSDYLQQHIFTPLLMNQSIYAGDNGIHDDHAIGYTGTRTHSVPARPRDPAWLYGGAGVITNVYDLAKWEIEMPILLRVDAVREMFTPSGVDAAQNYGLGWTIDERGGKRYVWRNGEIPGYHAMNALLPDDHIAVIVLSNMDDDRSPNVFSPESFAARVLDIVAPPAAARVDNAIVTVARDWLDRLATHRIDRTQLTPEFSQYLSDDLVARSNFAAFGKVQALVPISSMSAPNGGTVYEFLVRFTHEQDHYRIGLTKDGKIDELVLFP